MPIYEYRCGACGFQKEFLQKMSDARLTDCPECGKPTLNKMVTAAGFHLKGSGWYATDFKHGAKPAAKPEDKSGATPDGAPAGKSEDKSAAQTEAKSAAQSESKPAAEAPAKKPDTAAAGASSSSSASPANT